MMNRLDYLIEYLLKEDPQYSEMEIPSDLQGKRDLFRALRNVRWPKPVGEEFLHLQDEELQVQLQEKGVVDLPDVPISVGRTLASRGGIPAEVTLRAAHPAGGRRIRR